MESEDIIEALFTVWDELPDALGEDWPAFHARIEQLLLRLHHANDSAQRSSAASDLILAVREFPEARRRMHAVVQELASGRGGATRSGGAPESLLPAARGNWTDWVARLFHRAAPQPVERYADVTAPKQLPVGQRGTVTVRLTQLPNADSAIAQPMIVEPGQTVEITLIDPTGELEIEDETRELKIKADKDSEPVTFYIRGHQPGQRRLNLEFRQLGVLICWIAIEFEVTEEASEPTEQSQPANVVTGEVYVPPADLEIVVSMTRYNGETQLWYELHLQLEQLGYFRKRIAGPTFRGDPQHFQRHLIGKLENMGGGRDIDGKYLEFDQAEVELNSAGQWLYQQLFTDQMAAEYRRFRKHVRTLHIISDEPWIPWEVVKPYDDSDPTNVIDDDFLACQFAVARWMRSDRPPLGHIHVNRLACIEAGQTPHQSPLSYAGTERDYSCQPGSCHGHSRCEPISGGLDKREQPTQHGQRQAMALCYARRHGLEPTRRVPDHPHGRSQPAGHPLCRPVRHGRQSGPAADLLQRLPRGRVELVADSTRRLGRDARATKELRRTARPPLVRQRLARLRVHPPLLQRHPRRQNGRRSCSSGPKPRSRIRAKQPDMAGVQRLFPSEFKNRV